VTYSGCGAGAFSPAPAANDTSLTFASGTLSANSICTITVNVTAAAAGTYPNTTGNLFIDTSIDTGNFGSDTLTASTAGACTPGQTLARWTVPAGTTDPPDLAGGTPTTLGSLVTTATASANIPGNTSIMASGSNGDNTSWYSYGYKNSGQYV